MKILPTTMFPYGLVVGDNVKVWATPNSLFTGEIIGDVTAIFRDTDESPVVRVEYDNHEEGHKVFDLGLEHRIQLIDRHDGLRPDICDSFAVYNPQGEMVYIDRHPKTAQDSTADRLWAALTHAWISGEHDPKVSQFNPMETASKAFEFGYRVWPVKIVACRFPAV